MRNFRVLALLCLCALSGCSNAFAWPGGVGPRRLIPAAGGGGGTPSVLHAAVVAINGTGTCDYVVPNAITAGSRLVVFNQPLTADFHSVISDTQANSWTMHQTVDGSFGWMRMWSTLASAGSDTISLTVNTGTDRCAVYFAEVANAANGVDSGAALSTFYSPPPSDTYWGNATTTHTSIIFAAEGGVGMQGDAAITLDAGWSSVALSGNREALMMWKEVVTAGSLTPHVVTASGLTYGAWLWNGFY